MYTMELASHTVPLTVLQLLGEDGDEIEGRKLVTIIIIM